MPWQGPEAYFPQSKILSEMAVSPKIQNPSLQVKTIANRRAVRWYLMCYPYGRKGLTDGLERELARRKIEGEPLFEYFAPTYIETKEVDGRLVTTKTSLLYNYFFIHASEDEVFRLKKHEPQYNFLHKVVGKDNISYFPYVKDSIIQTLQWIARSYSGYIPLYLLDQTLLVKGDRIRVTKGQFKGVEARIVTRPDSAVREVMVFIDNWMCVPLMNVRPTQYEIIDVNNSGDRPASSYGLDNQKLAQELHVALCHHLSGVETEDDIRLAEDVFRRFAFVVVDSAILRCKLYSFLLPACRILGNREKLEGLLKIIQVMLPSIKAEQSLALLSVTVYACTDNCFFHDQAHQIIDPWLAEPAPKRSKKNLIDRLADYDRILGHENKR